MGPSARGSAGPRLPVPQPRVVAVPIAKERPKKSPHPSQKRKASAPEEPRRAKVHRITTQRYAIA